MKTLFSIGLTYSILDAIIFGGITFLKSCLTDEDIVVNIIKYLVDSISTNILYSLIITLVISIILIVVYNIIKPKVKNN